MGGALPSYLVTQPGHSKREFNMGDDADGCCTLKRGSGIFILVLSIISLVGTVICAVIASATEMGLYAAFNWIHFVLLIYLVSAASAYVCCRACGSKITGGLAVGYCVLAFVTFIVLATGQRSAIKHNCEGTVECASISDWGDHEPECGRKTSSFSLCYLPETDGRRRRLASSLGYTRTSGYCRQDGDAAVDTTGHKFTSPGSGTDEWCRERCDEDPSCVAFDNCNECWLHGAPRSTGVGGGCECWVKNLPKVTLYEDTSRGAGCDALDNSGNVVDADSADHCCQGEGYCCDYGSCASDSDYCGYRFRCGGAVVSWYEPADGVPLSGLESSQACESRGQRLCLYDELCPSGEDTAPVGMPSSHSDWMPFLSTTYGRRWMHGGCKVHEDLYDEGCGVSGCGTSPVSYTHLTLPTKA